MKTILVVVGTRPEIIKMAPIVWELERRMMPYKVLFTAQHWDRNMGLGFFTEMNYVQQKVICREPPSFNSTGQAWLPDLMSADLSDMLSKGNFGMVLAEGDTHTVGRTALVCVQKSVPFAHIEAGLRSFDFSMLEERYRSMADAVADYLFVPLPYQLKNVRDCRGTKFVVGNTIVDALKYTLADSSTASVQNRALITLHRWELLKDPQVFEECMTAISRGLHALGMHAIFPIHPHTSKLFELAGRFPLIEVVEPMEARQFLQALAESRFVLTDSGGVQEEACILGIPCGVLRDRTERPETVDIGAAILLPPKRMIGLPLNRMLELKRGSWKHPYGEDVGRKIVDVIEVLMGR